MYELKYTSCSHVSHTTRSFTLLFPFASLLIHDCNLLGRHIVHKQACLHDKQVGCFFAIILFTKIVANMANLTYTSYQFEICG